MHKFSMGLLAAVATLVVMISFGAWAKEPAKLAVCAACHGKDGVGTQDKYPNLAGQKKAYMVTQLKAFKAGERKNPEMQPMAAMLSDADVEELATYFSGLGSKKEAKKK